MEEKLVLVVSVYPELYDVSDRSHHNRDRKAHLWKQLGRTPNVAGECWGVFSCVVNPLLK